MARRWVREQMNQAQDLVLGKTLKHKQDSRRAGTAPGTTGAPKGRPESPLRFTTSSSQNHSRLTTTISTAGIHPEDQLESYSEMA